MATNAPNVKLGRITLSETHLKGLEQVLYQYADMRDRILADGGIPYTQGDPRTIQIPPGGA